MKLVNNVVAASVRTVTFEAVAMGIKNGLSLKTCAEVLAKGSARSYSTEITLPRLLSGNAQASFTLGLMHKDVRLGHRARRRQRLADDRFRRRARAVPDRRSTSKAPMRDVNTMIRLFERQSKVKVVP